jgi:hypothetical protein
MTMPMPMRIRIMPQAAWVALLLAGWLATGCAAPATAWAGESPLNVAIHDLMEHPDQYDGRLVLVRGYVGHVAWERGRRGSEYVVLTVEEAGTKGPASVSTVTVIALTGPKIRPCQQVLVQGVYHREGKQAGRPYELFIDADAVIPDVPPASSLVPSDCEEKI